MGTLPSPAGIECCPAPVVLLTLILSAIAVAKGVERKGWQPFGIWDIVRRRNGRLMFAKSWKTQGTNKEHEKPTRGYNVPL